MTAPTLTPLYDQALEELLDGDVVYVNKCAVAVAVVTHDDGRCPELVCQRCVEETRKGVADALRGLGRLYCYDCGRWPIDPAAVRVRAI